MENITQFVLKQTILWGPSVGIALVVFLIFWILSKIASRTIIKAGDKTQLNAHVTSLLARSAKIALICFGVVTALGNLRC